MKNIFSIENRLKPVNYLVKIMDGKLDNDTINNIKEKVLNLGINSYSGTVHVESTVFYTSLDLSLDIGKKFKGGAWGFESIGYLNFTGTLLTSDIDRLTTEGTLYTMADTAVGISILFLNTSLSPLGSFEGIGGPMIGVASGHGNWS
ncbi:VapA/VapB family virulence-associated protein [Xenorhabdus sp. Reich]|uniref:VapA/VapB family virulence-associated protein n=1 Tax=Xenorhabdus littoralis TaxID=2582835 RepID=A0ABU4SK70_9GAMM|nr:VapA/VapB family virulence-associated protein [Xenorhabdus sp. Reich]MDX7999055.1 VapA/VapB family virulence-associated protein [Xenorhabdus sp. Reich]